MISHLLAWLSLHILAVISRLGYTGVSLLMAIESACVPIPSEIILPSAGYLAFMGRFRLPGIALAGALGCNLGSMVAYSIGFFGGRPLARRYGKWLLLSPADLDQAEVWVRKHGGLAVWICRMLPVVQTFIALPAGMARMPLGKLNLATFAGSLAWCFGMSYLGFRLGANWDQLAPYFHRFDTVFAVVIFAAAAFALWHHVRRFRRGVEAEAAEAQVAVE